MKRQMEKLLRRYHLASDYERPAIRFTLRNVYGFYCKQMNTSHLPEGS